MKAHDPVAIDYEAPRHRERRRFAAVTWLVPGVSGGAAGWVLGNCGDGWECFAVVAGFVVAALSAALAPRRRLAFGLMGNGCTVVAWLTSWAIGDWRRGKPPSIDVTPSVALILTAVSVLPGLLGILLVSAAHSASRPPTRFD